MASLKAVLVGTCIVAVCEGPRLHVGVNILSTWSNVT